MIREYHLASEDLGVEGDSTYTLVFTENGEMRVSIARHFKAQYRTPETHSLEPKDFDRISVDERSLRELVIDKLATILPHSA